MKLSIITINSNNGNGLKQTLESVAGQTFMDFEHIIIDGASTDNSIEVIKSFPHITYYVSESDDGIYDAMNKGIKQAKGKYCLFLNSGDYLASPTVIFEMFEKSGDEDMICGDVILKYQNGETLPVKIPPEISLGFLFTRTLAHPSTFIKTELLAKLKNYRTDLQIVSDWAFFVEAIFIYGASYKHYPIFVSVFMCDGISSNPKMIPLMQDEREKVLKELFPYTYKDIVHLLETEAELKRVYKIPGVKFIMKYVYPLYRRLRYRKNSIAMEKIKGGQIGGQNKKQQ